MESINGIITELMGQLKNINQNLSNLADEKGGIVVHDTYANISTWVNMGTTVLATLIGTIIGTGFTIWLFKRQEKMRIKEEIRLDFYKGYKELYSDLVDTIESLKLEIISMKEIYSDGFIELLYITDESNEHENPKFNVKFQEDTQKDKFILIKSIYIKLNKLKKYISKNKTISEIDINIYNQVDENIEKIKSYFSIMETTYKLIGKIQTYQKHHLSMITLHNKLIDDMINSDVLLEKILKDIDYIHLEIENTFVGQYFKK